MTGEKPIAFMSYSHFYDEHDGGALTTFCQRLSGEVRVHTGEDFSIFQDRKDIKWGQAWKARVDESLNEVTFLIPITTPNFFKSDNCRNELNQFLEREKTLGREDLILPVYYIETPLLKDSIRRKEDELAQIINDRQYVNWRELRFESFGSSEARKKMAALAVQIRDALEERVSPPPKIDEPKKYIHRASKRNSILIVDPMCRGDYATIPEAIEAANPGDIILVRPGLYQEGLVIDKPLEIVGEGERYEIEVQATGRNALVFRTTNGRVANLTLRQMGGGNWYCVDIAKGRLILEDCDISSQSSVCVAIHNGADPRLRRNKIHDGKSSGVFVYENGKGTLEENEIFGNSQPGVAIITGGNPTLRRNKIHDGKNTGVFVYKNGKGTLEENEIFRNSQPGVDIATGGNPTLCRNKIHDGKNAGVFVYENGEGTLEENEIFENSQPGVAITTGGNPTLRRNKINKNKFQAIYICEGGGGVIEDNDLRDNATGAWYISADSEPNVKRARNLE